MPFAQTDSMSSAYLTRVVQIDASTREKTSGHFRVFTGEEFPWQIHCLVLKFGVFLGENAVTHLNCAAIFIMDCVFVISVAVSYISKVIYIMILNHIVRREPPPSLEKQGV